MYPINQLLEVKISESLEELTVLKNQLDFFQEFSGIDKLQQEAQFLLNDKENIQIENIITCKNKINNFIKLNYSIKEKLDQVNFFMPLVDIYFEQSEIQTINSSLSIQKNKLQQLINNESQDENEIAKCIATIDSLFFNKIDKLLEKIKQFTLSKFINTKYQAYLVGHLELITQSENEIKDKKEKISFLFNQLHFSTEFIKQLEISYKEFEKLQKIFKSNIEKYQELNKTLIKSEDINISKAEVEHQIESLSKEFAEFDPRLNSLDTLSYGFQDFDQKLRQLDQLNRSELQNQQMELISLVKNSRKTLIEHSEKLSHSSTKCAKDKYQAIEIIKGKIDLLLRVEIEDDASNQKMNDNILELKQTISGAKAILSEYRGISLLRCFAALWGGGKVTSELLVNKLEGQLTDLQKNMSRLSPSS
ncbi:hypothetical protein [Rickettsiella endosymbiont of Miltochrista miniata]|uniref:hypothetical protein n=1 Tax=Rickettsiella endosymbiont of Miltochrista miniata TaxID=3066239 RepID=UPI00313D4F1A